MENRCVGSAMRLHACEALDWPPWVKELKKLGFKKNNGTFKSPLTLSHCVCLLLCIAREMLFQRLDLILIFHLQGDDLLLNFALFHF